MAELALSTMWAQGRFRNMGGFVRAVRGLGFQRIEINYTVDPRGLEELLEADQVAVSSLHAPVPKVRAANGSWSYDLNLASLDDEECRLALEATKATIDWAAKVGAACVVLHLGGIGSETLPAERLLRQMFNAGQANSYGANFVRADCHRLRGEQVAPHLARARASLAELADQAAGLGVALGLENRYHYHEIPTVDEALELLNGFPPHLVGYWHDVGHAEVLDRLGLIDKQRWLGEMGKRCLGVHLHDVAVLKDHQAPGQGNVDWGYIARYLPPTALRVLEVNQDTPPQAVAGAIPYLRGRGVVF